MYRLPVYKISLVREKSVKIEDRPQVFDAQSAYHIIMTVIGPSDREHFGVIPLDSRNRPIGVNIVSIGSKTATIVAPPEVFKILLLVNATSFVIFHNHPSGDPEPSCEDTALTSRLKEIGDLMGIRLLDHIVCGYNCFVSLRERGLI